MIRATIGELLDGQLDGYESVNECIVYVVRDGDVVLYVGKAVRVIERLWSHLGTGSYGWTGISQLGVLIQANLPMARRWSLELMTGEDCLSVLQECTGNKYFTGANGSGYLLVKSISLDDGVRLEQRLAATNAEELESELIRVYHPCLNSAGNLKPTPLPDHYTVPWRSLRDTSWQAVAELLMPKKEVKRGRRKKRQ